MSLFNLRSRGDLPDTPGTLGGIVEETKDAGEPVRALCFIFNVTQKSGRDKCDKKLKQTLDFTDAQ